MGNRAEITKERGQTEHKATPTHKKTAVTYIRLVASSSHRKAILARYNQMIQEETREREVKVVCNFKDLVEPGDLDKQPELRKMLRYIGENKVDYVIVPRLNMLTKKMPVLLKIVERIELCGVELVTPSGEETMLPMYKIAANSAHEMSDNMESRYWATCTICDAKMIPGQGCIIDTVYCNGRAFDRIKVGDELDFNPNMEDGDFCHDCNAKKGQYHHWNCDAEQCPFCHEQLVGCDCDVEVLMKRHGKL